MTVGRLREGDTTGTQRRGRESMQRGTVGEGRL